MVTTKKIILLTSIDQQLRTQPTPEFDVIKRLAESDNYRLERDSYSTYLISKESSGLIIAWFYNLNDIIAFLEVRSRLDTTNNNYTTAYDTRIELLTPQGPRPIRPASPRSRKRRATNNKELENEFFTRKAKSKGL